MRKGKSYSEAGSLGGIKSKEYWKKIKQTNIEKYMVNPKLCPWCKSIIKYQYRDRKFCNHSCAAKSHNSQREFQNREIKPCLECGKESQKLKFCSHECRSLFNTKQLIQESENNNKIIGSIVYRTFLIKTYGAKCMKCGWAEIHPITNKVPIQMNHIDGNSENNKLSNLELLCPNCHSLTPTFGILNKGNGRFIRRQRYLEGKSR